jgi:hypothetical protein
LTASRIMLRWLQLLSTCGGELMHLPVSSKDVTLTQRLQDYWRILCGLLSTEVDRHHRPRCELRLSSNGAGGSIHCRCSDNAILGKKMATCLPGTGDRRELNVLPCLRCHAIATSVVHDSIDHYHWISFRVSMSCKSQFCSQFMTSEHGLYETRFRSIKSRLRGID